MASEAFANRTSKKLVLFDVDGTLSLARQTATPEMMDLLRALRKKVVIGVVGGSDLVKVSEQLSVGGAKMVDEFDFAFAENGLTAFKLGQQLPSQSFIQYLGEDRYKPLVNFMLRYIADLDIPIKRYVCPLGFIDIVIDASRLRVMKRDFYRVPQWYGESFKNESTSSNSTRTDPQKAGVRAAFVQALKENFPDYPLTYSIGGQISFDVFPNGWDKTYCLRHVEDEHFEEIHFFGDKTYKGGNDYEIFSDPRTIGHSVKNPDDTMRLLREMFF
ncbi:hypothetical protein NM688_g6780 [Phlebia brevispora]|uniref:Uncharacterized protein n=1 Tax=Phlebia brevispora TaxID=194682 RepID=A0ACC1SCI8_9APHY|nr:hypothetical protein NM688_g6780 [Phlebia brevispora]